MNIGWNLIAPYNGTNKIGGAAAEVGSSAALEWFVRWMLKNKTRTIWGIATAHALSKPFRGGVTAWHKNTALKVGGQHVNQLLTGAKDSISVIMGYGLLSIAQKGFVFGFPSFWELFIIVGSKTAHQEILSFVNSYLPKALQDQFAAGDIQRQSAENNSNLSMKKK